MPPVSFIRYLSYRLVSCFLLLYFIPSAQARECFFDGRNTICRGLSNGARIGIAFGLFALAVLIIVGLGAMRRRRIQRANLLYVTNQQAGGYQGDSYVHNQGYPPGYTTGTPQNYPPYPPQAHVDPTQYGPYVAPAGYDTQQYNVYPSYAPPSGPPPPTAKQ